MRRLSMGLILLALTLGMDVVRAQEGERREPAAPRVRRLEVRTGQVGKQWIGVQTTPLDEALKSQLNLDEGLLISQVVPDSPAAKAGLQQYDIVLQFGDRAVKNLQGLLEALEAGAGQPTTIEILRGGKKRTLEIQPTERPAHIVIDRPGRAWLNQLEPWLGRAEGIGDDQRPLRMRLMGPGVLLEQAERLPGNLSISVHREGDQPAKITVKRNDESWQVTEETLDQLPAELRPHVQRLLGRPGGGIVIQPPLNLPNLPDQAPRLEEALRRLDELREQLNREDPLKALREELENLRREIEKLRGNRSPSDREESETRGA